MNESWSATVTVLIYGDNGMSPPGVKCLNIDRFVTVLARYGRGVGQTNGNTTWQHRVNSTAAPVVWRRYSKPAGYLGRPPACLGSASRKKKRKTPPLLWFTGFGVLKEDSLHILSTVRICHPATTMPLMCHASMDAILRRIKPCPRLNDEYVFSGHTTGKCEECLHTLHQEIRNFMIKQAGIQEY